MAKVVARPAVSFFFSLTNVHEDHRKRVKLKVKTKIEQLDPVDSDDPAETARHKWNSLPAVAADDDGHIDETTVKANLQEQLTWLNGETQYVVGQLTEWCYIVRGGDIYCYHCYELTEVAIVQGQPVLVPVIVPVDVTGGSGATVHYDIPLSVSYSWATPF